MVSRQRCWNLHHSALLNHVNFSTSTGIYLIAWKRGRITSTSKERNNSLPSGYRLISILPTVNKLIGRYVKVIIEDFLQLHAPISPGQWGFMSNCSTVSALNDWLSAIDQGNEVCVVFFDVSKAFDTVHHLALLHKLNELGLDPYLLRCIRNYI